MPSFESFLQKSLTDNNYNFSSSIQQTFLNYLELLDKWNQVINLTAIRNFHQMVTHHLLDSLAIMSYLQGEYFIDVGSGAGLPGIPLAIVFPEKNFCLLDSNSKKTRFLTQVMLELEIKNISVVHARCEQFHPEKCFDAVITRAFSSLAEMLELTQHLLCPTGEFLAMKGIYPRSELKEIPAKFKVLAVDEIQIKGLDEKRCLVRIQQGC